MSSDLNHNVFAAIDIGSHTIRLLIAAVEEGRCLLPLVRDRHITRLARGFQADEWLQPEACAHSLRVLKAYAGELASHQARHTCCGATGVFRRARNATALVDQIFSETGLRVDVLSEHQEAVLSAKGIRSALPATDRVRVCFDLGGSTTELAVLEPASAEPVFTESVLLGAATVTERFFPDAPAAPDSLRKASQYAEARLRPAVQRALARASKAAPGPQIVGTAGTVTTLTAMQLGLRQYRPQLVNGRTLDHDWIEQTIARLSHLSLDQRVKIAGLEPGREDIILGGALIVSAILKLFQQSQLLTADAGLLEGLLVIGIEQQLGPGGVLPTPLTWHWKSE